MTGRTAALLAAALLACACRSPGEKEAAAAQVAADPATASTPTTGVAGRVYVVERGSGSLAIYDLIERRLLDQRIDGLGDLHHAVMAFSPDLRWGYVATRGGLLTRIDLERSVSAGSVQVSRDSIDIAIAQDGRLVATAEYNPGGINFLDARTLERRGRISAEEVLGVPSRVTGVVDAPGGRFVCVAMEGAEVWVIDASGATPRIERRIPTPADPYDAMITPDGRWYLVGHLGSAEVSVVDLHDPAAPLRPVSLRDPGADDAFSAPVKLPHLASWAVAGDHAFVPLVGENRLAVLDRDSWKLVRSIPLRGHPVYAVASPTQDEIWVSFSGEADDAWIQVIDTRSFEVTRQIEVGGRIYHFDFTPRGSHVLVSANRANQLVLVDASTYAVVDRETLNSPSGVFGAWRAFRIGL